MVVNERSATRGTLFAVMHPTIPIQTTLPTAAAGCGACLHSAAGPVCRSAQGEPCLAPELSGPPDLLRQVLAELDRELAVQTERERMHTGLVQALKLGDGEAELTLGVAAHCSGALLADAAFQTLRRLLPDTDIYVRCSA